jgi:hypothetical protein
MIAKIFAILIIASIGYIGSIFLIPDLADTYGNPSLNATIRLWKVKLESTGSE